MFGRDWGTLAILTRNKPKDYAQSKFIRWVKGDKVDFAVSSRPAFYMKVYPPYYRSRTRLERVIKGVPHADARRIGNLLSRLSPEQIANAIRAAFYTPEQVSMWMGVDLLFGAIEIEKKREGLQELR